MDALLTAAASLSEQQGPCAGDDSSATQGIVQAEQLPAADGPHASALAPEAYYHTLQALTGTRDLPQPVRKQDAQNMPV